MARTFRRHRASHPIAELNVTNLIDLGFTLLIIFMIATPLINQEQSIPVNLPVESKSTQKKPDPETRFVSVTIDGRGNTFIDNTQVPAKDLGIRLKGIAAAAKDPKDVVVKLRADGGVNYQKVITVMDELKNANLSRISFDTQTGK
ncbi:ExbD/TolR family protein [Nibricoccus sp. IMCC34717]|uniref:ExbD/TolR family protein n=1 Tax=Nibricoccus sp. IMCC34717 TaxID=3034021 RepID=UPI0038502C68